ncbi:MAG: DUF4349 domain-containing protein [Ferruginibacter sp.]
MNPRLFFSALLFSSVLFSCDYNSKKELDQAVTLSKPGKEEQSPTTDNSEVKQKIPASNLKQEEKDTIAGGSLPQPATHIDWDKKIIRTATVRLEVKDFKKYNERIHIIIRQNGGYIAQEEQNLTDEKSETILSIKVPVEQFEGMMNDLPAGDVKILERMITSQDVTGEVIDTRTRMEAKKQVRLKYLDFLKASKNMEEVLKVQNEINSIQEEIEAAAGRVEYLSHQSAFSTINLTFYQPFDGFKPVDLSPSFLNRITNAFKAGADWIADLFVALISIWPLLMITIGGLIIFKRLKYLKSNLRNP